MLILKITAFAVTLFFGIAISEIVSYRLFSLDEEIIAERKTELRDAYTSSDSRELFPGGSGSSGRGGTSSGTSPKITIPLKIVAKQKASYTEQARENGTEGTVTLRVTFLASGNIGSITVVNSLPDGLTEKAIEAAQLLQFEPQKADGIPQTTSRPVSYTFSLY